MKGTARFASVGIFLEAVVVVFCCLSACPNPAHAQTVSGAECRLQLVWDLLPKLRDLTRLHRCQHVCHSTRSPL